MAIEETNPVHFTDKAREELRRKMVGLGLHHPVLRIGVKTVGAHSVDYLLAFDRREENDMVFQESGWTYVIAPKDMMFIMGMTIDYESGEKGSGFIFEAATKKKPH